jgi:hypothetical protein
MCALIFMLSSELLVRWSWTVVDEREMRMERAGLS